eukprot:1159077-Pelagomonas_calceolata.AAC.9
MDSKNAAKAQDASYSVVFKASKGPTKQIAMSTLFHLFFFYHVQKEKKRLRKPGLAACIKERSPN